ncbi:hypothetical protein K502DRAFT_325321 [Neoconidiobolus thromboides FSU 785]|nr:hypothetical protein K502DRAFT_325321 [Neoconidiobolus thromboides FSU 785]
MIDPTRMNYEDQLKFNRILTKIQQKDTIDSIIKLNERCFIDCNRDLTTDLITEKENKCLEKCVFKFFLVSERLSKRLSENQEIKKALNMEQ